MRCSWISTGLALPWNHSGPTGGTGFASALIARESQVTTGEASATHKSARATVLSTKILSQYDGGVAAFTS